MPKLHSFATTRTCCMLGMRLMAARQEDGMFSCNDCEITDGVLETLDADGIIMRHRKLHAESPLSPPFLRRYWMSTLCLMQRGKSWTPHKSPTLRTHGGNWTYAASRKTVVRKGCDAAFNRGACNNRKLAVDRNEQISPASSFNFITNLLWA